MSRLVTLCVMATVLLGATPAKTRNDIDHQTYVRYCGACHGPVGKGDGIASQYFNPKPIDLTQIAKQNGGQFPYNRVMRIIDGRETTRAHGDPLMPVWGEIFAEQADRSRAERQQTQAKLMRIADYLRSIQEK